MTEQAAATRKAAPTRRGRPALDTGERESRILDALEQVVAEAGFQGATMDAVARAAGMSKRTLYAIHDSRAALFEAWVRRVRTLLVRPLPAEARTLPLTERLRLLLRREVRFAMSDRRLSVLRAVIAEAPRNPDLARAFFREGAAAARAIVAAELHAAVRTGEIVTDDVETAAEILFDMVYQSPLDRLINPDARHPNSQAADARLDRAIGIFLDGVRARPV